MRALGNLTWELIICILYFYGNDRGDQLSVADCLSWIGRPSPELTLTAMSPSAPKADSCTLSPWTKVVLHSLWLFDVDWIIVECFACGCLFSEGTLILPPRIINQWDAFIERIWLHIFDLADTIGSILTNNIQGNHPNYYKIMYHCAMFPKLKSIKFNAFLAHFSRKGPDPSTVHYSSPSASALKSWLLWTYYYTESIQCLYTQLI